MRAGHAALKLPDALVIATAISLGADRILTTNRAWPMIGVEVQRLGVRLRA